MQKSCAQCAQQFEITERDIAFYRKIGVPHPKTCPSCRLYRRLQERKNKNLYYRTCDFSGEKIVSQYPENSPFPVYKINAWWSDKWNPMDYGMEYDFNRPFFDQVLDLRDKVPRLSLSWAHSENTEYANCVSYNKNCFLIFESNHNEHCYYSNVVKNCRFVMDCTNCFNSELCYFCTDCRNCYNMKYSKDCISCQDSLLLKDCISCKDCIGCINQRHKQYMVFNEQLTKELYEKYLRELDTGSAKTVAELKKKAAEFFLPQFHRSIHNENNENCRGNYLYNSKNADQCFDSSNVEDCRYCVKIFNNVKSSYDYSAWGDNAELIYQTASSGDNIYNLKFCVTCATGLRDSEYCDSCINSHDLFGCNSLRSHAYCILNRQYTKEDYFKLKARIVEKMTQDGEYGEFFPNEYCTFGYNETIAMDYFPLTREEALKRGYKWVEIGAQQHYKGPKIPVPENLKDAGDDITGRIFECKDCGKNYKVIGEELKLYRKIIVPIPDKCHDCRCRERLAQRHPPILYDRKCAKCGGKMTTSFAPDKPEIVYCEKCYLKEVY